MIVAAFRKGPNLLLAFTDRPLACALQWNLSERKRSDDSLRVPRYAAAKIFERKPLIACAPSGCFMRRG